MKSESPLNNLVMRTAVVRQSDTGYIISCDPQKEKDEIPHAITFRWNAGKFNKGDRNYNAHTACLIQQPEPGFLDVSGQGYYSVNTRNGMTSGDILDNSEHPAKKPRIASFRSVSEIGGKAYAVGLRGLVYRLDELEKWTRIDEGLPESFNVQAIHGFDGSDIYAVGRNGDLWHFNGNEWTNYDLPTNVNLTAIKCAGDGNVYIAGHKGILIRGRLASWEAVEHQGIEDDIWDLEWFEGHLYVSTMHAVFRLANDELEPVDFGDDSPGTCYQLSAANGVMWSNGAHDIMSFDGSKWTRVV